MRCAKTILLFFALIGSFPISAQSNTFSLSDWNKITSLSSPALSPDGKRALVISTRKNFELNRNESELHLIETATKVSSSLVKDRSGLGMAKWSPSGNWISFVASAKYGRQLFILPAAPGESQQLTEVQGSIRAYEWNSTSDRIAFILSSPPKKNEEPFNDSFEVGNHDFLKQQPSSIHTLWVYDFKTKASKQILPDSISVSTELVTSSLSWSPDGKKIIVTIFPTSNSGDSDSGRIAEVDVIDGQQKYLTSHRMFEGDGKYSNEGKVALLFPRDGIAANQTELHLIQGSSISNVSQETDREIADYAWLVNGEIIFSGDNVNRTTLWQRTAAGKITPLDLGDVTSVSSWEAHQKGILFVGTERYRRQKDGLCFSQTTAAAIILGINFKARSRMILLKDPAEM